MDYSLQANMGLWYFVVGAMLRMGMPIIDSLKVARNIPGSEEFTDQVAQLVESGESLADAVFIAAKDNEIEIPQCVITLTELGGDVGHLDGTCLSAALIIYKGDREKLFNDFYELTGLTHPLRWFLNDSGKGKALYLSELPDDLDDFKYALITDGLSFTEAVSKLKSPTMLNHPIVAGLLSAAESKDCLFETMLFLTPDFEDQADTFRGFDRAWIMDLELLFMCHDSNLSLEDSITKMSERSPNERIWDEILRYLRLKRGSTLSEAIRNLDNDTPLAQAEFLRCLDDAGQEVSTGIRHFLPGRMTAPIISKGQPPELYLFYMLKMNGNSDLEAMQRMNWQGRPLDGPISAMQKKQALSQSIDPETSSHGSSTSWIISDDIFRFIKAGERIGDIEIPLVALSCNCAWPHSIA